MFDQFPTSFIRNPSEAYNQVIGRWYNDFLKIQEFKDIDDDERGFAFPILSDLTACSITRVVSRLNGAWKG